MNITIIREMIDRYLQDRATESEKRLIEKWLQARPEDDRSLSDPDKQEVQAALWQSFTRHTDWSDKATTKTPSLFPYRTWVRYAAAIVVILASALWLNNTFLKKQIGPSQTITAMAGSHKTAMLPDSSMVYLFPGSSVTIPPDFNSHKRNITLSGKVFFEVKPDPTRPFFVQAGQLRTQVLGTSFEVTAQDSAYTSVIVRTGKVGVQYNGRPLADLIPGKRLRYNRQQNNFTVDDVNAAMLCEWWNNGMVFNQSPLEEVLQSVSAWYNVPIAVTGTRWKKETVTIRIKNKSFAETLSLLSATLGFQYKTENNRIIIF
ncbi:FecR family protein [Chitinophaga arvensicola]|uniref:Ferric-dicitrate binding protein FerR, regulates iron transport through sigma-19 n=1 Tax=Chitinophaga arvensicola TaxID=29529 RepID=A0A1I0R3I5_9BACT|nr:FecR family protein [Chitinophaga arvensicola]SEW34976.1 ferric-dicitrate binding protein FerR, regulates iron transport through sigma-19 [Chitinophaga arvensicola]